MPKKEFSQLAADVFSYYKLPSLPFIDSHLDQASTIAFIRCVFLDQNINPETEKLINQLFFQKEYQSDFNNELYFHWICEQPSHWLNQYTEIFEALWSECLARDTQEKIDCHVRIKVLVEKSKSGLSLQYLEPLCLKNDFALEVQVEVDSYLLMIKLQEQEMLKDPDLQLWKKQTERIKGMVSKKPYLIVVLLYLHRQIHREQFIDDFKEWATNWEIYSCSFLDDFQMLKPYFVTYLKQWLYHHYYFEILNNIDDGILRIIEIYPNQSQWVNEVFDQVLNDDVLLEVKQEINKHLKANANNKGSKNILQYVRDFETELHLN